MLTLFNHCLETKWFHESNHAPCHSSLCMHVKSMHVFWNTYQIPCVVVSGWISVTAAVIYASHWQGSLCLYSSLTSIILPSSSSAHHRHFSPDHLKLIKRKTCQSVDSKIQSLLQVSRFMLHSGPRDHDWIIQLEQSPKNKTVVTVLWCHLE